MKYLHSLKIVRRCHWKTCFNNIHAQPCELLSNLQESTCHMSAHLEKVNRTLPHDFPFETNNVASS